MTALRTIPDEELFSVFEKGQKSIETLMSQWPDNLNPLQRKGKLRQLYGQRVRPIEMLLDNFEPQNYVTRNCDDDIRRSMLLESFKAFASIKKIAEETPDDQTVKEFVTRRVSDVHAAYYTYACDGECIDDDKETRAKKGAALMPPDFPLSKLQAA